MKGASRYTGIFVAVGLAFVVVAAGLIAALFSLRDAFWEPRRPKVDPLVYSELMAIRHAPEYYGHFPAAITPTAVRTAFFLQPSFFQGGEIIALRLQLPDEEISQLLDELKRSERQEVSEVPVATELCYPKFGLKSSEMRRKSFLLSDALEKLPAGFRIFLFKTDVRDATLNHGILSFTAISTERNEVLYFSDIW